MNLKFLYDKDKDANCLLKKGKSSNNSQESTVQYLELVKKYGESPTMENALNFVDDYVVSNNIDVDEYIKNYEKDWSLISEGYHKRAEKIFGITLPNDVTAYLTINGRSPYSIQSDYFLVYFPTKRVTKIVMHELWHFYTWYGLGIDQEEKLGFQKYNDLKESLSVLINIECADLLPKDIFDNGYPQHQETRDKIVKFWEKEKDIFKLWNYLIK